MSSKIDVEKIRNLREEGLSISEINRITGYSTSTITKYVKDIFFKVGRYRKELPVGIYNGSIIDIETTGLDPSSDDIITFGFIENNQVHVLQRAEASATEYYSIMNDVLIRLPNPIYAYNAEFEQSFLKAKVGFEENILDVFEPFKIRSDKEGHKYPSLDELAPLPREYFGDKQTRGKHILSFWQMYCTKKDRRSLASIVRHNREDLVQTLAVLGYFHLEK